MVGVVFLLPLIFVLCLLSGLVSVFLFLVPAYLFVKLEPKNLPDGNMGWPIIGETLGFLKPHKSNTLGDFLQDHCSRYGRIFKSHLFGHPTIVSCDHDLNMFILQNEERLFQCSYPKSIHGVLGNLSLLCVVGDLHKRLRSYALNFTNTCKSKVEYINDVDKLTISLMESWKNKKEVIFCEEVKKFTFNFIVKQIISMDAEEAEATTILEDFHTFMKGVVSLPLYIPGTAYAKAVKARLRIYSTIKAIIRERTEGHGIKKGDYLDALLSNSSSSDEEKVSIVLDLLLGGYETTSTLIALIVYFLSHSPHALQMLKEEHQATRKRKQEEALNWEDYKQMEFTQNVVINEALRCGNVVKFVHRKALKDVNFKGFLIPSGWKVLPIFAAAHLDPSIHENATEFNPWRWNSQVKVKNYAPFSGGLRLCPGAEIGKIETAIFLHHLVLNFRWRIQGVDYPLSKPYVEFLRGLQIELEPLEMN
ncbi:Cytochrome P450 [Macleaya cordata]|uniref:Cytochrome P450 724B1 n=1 Tax=Macleaya cordata TaxID=56857 RepID=A0A200R4J4_MACCD|nr:Cytochrome P450 [Macleaya cordata]